MCFTPKFHSHRVWNHIWNMSISQTDHYKLHIYFCWVAAGSEYWNFEWYCLPIQMKFVSGTICAYASVCVSCVHMCLCPLGRSMLNALSFWLSHVYAYVWVSTINTCCGSFQCRRFDFEFIHKHMICWMCRKFLVHNAYTKPFTIDSDCLM